MKLNNIILSAIIALIPTKTLAQSVLDNIPAWARNRNNPSYVKIHTASPFTYAVDRHYVLLNNGRYGVVVYSMSTYNPDPMFGRTYYEFNCQTSQYVFLGEIAGHLKGGEIEEIYWIAPCNTEICKAYARMDENINAGIKKYCPR